MKYKICFLSGAYRTVDADCFTIGERFLVFVKGGNPVLTAVLANVAYWHPAAETESLGALLARKSGSSRAGSKARRMA